MTRKDIQEAFSRWFALFSGEANACGKKIRYQTPVHATKAAYNMESKCPGEFFDVYKCPFCDRYHIGHAVDPKVFGFMAMGEDAEQDFNVHFEYLHRND